MKLLRLNHIIALSLLLLCTLKFITCLAIGPAVSADETRDIQTCIAACRNFRTIFYHFALQLNRENWEAAQKEFSTCQYRCYKCSLKKAVMAMDTIQKLQGDLAEEENKYVILNLEQYLIVESIQRCEDKWKIASSMGCTKIPVEEAVHLNTKDCIQ